VSKPQLSRSSSINLTNDSIKKKSNSSCSSNSNTSWGKFKGSNTLHIEESNCGLLPDLLVEITDYNQLISSWGALNRGFGWCLQLEAVSCIGSVVGGTRGYINRSVMDPNGSKDVKGCRWVCLHDSTIINKVSIYSIYLFLTIYLYLFLISYIYLSIYQ
jgi:hypothetical protein